MRKVHGKAKYDHLGEFWSVTGLNLMDEGD